MSRAIVILNGPEDREKVAKWAKCKVNDCQKNAHWSARGAKGYCSSHHRRLKVYGHPEGGRTPPGEAIKYLTEFVLNYTGDECLVWPYARTSAGYGHIWFNKSNFLVSRLVCAHKNGEPSEDNMIAAHTCGKGHLGCCNPNHLVWATPKENSSHKKRHGTHLSGETCPVSKLKEKDIKLIRSSDMSHDELSKALNCTPGNIRAIRNNKSWRHVK